jgi:uncharacterized membrane protein YbaN (DUF454 family)
MNPKQAKEILSAYRPGTDDERDPLLAEALKFARADAELSAWLGESLTFDNVVRQQLARVSAPRDLRDAILAQGKIIRPVPWWNPHLSTWQMAAAAMVIAALGLAALWFEQRPKTFAEFRREIADQSWGPTPHVEAKAASLTDVHDFLAAHGLSTNFTVPSTLAQSQVRGCTLMHWRGHEVPVICFNSQGQHLHLIVVNRHLFPDAPSQTPQTDQWEAWRTASWSKDDHSYVLTGLGTTSFVKKFRKAKHWDWEG